MNKLLLAALLGVPSAVIAWTSVDDPRCHDEPNNPVIPPTPGPTPYPPAPTPITVYDPPTDVTPPPTAVCSGFVQGFQIIDGGENVVVDLLMDGDTISLSDMPADFSVKAITAGTVAEVKLLVDGSVVGTDSTAPFTFPSTDSFNLAVEGTYTLSAYDGSSAGDKPCEITVTVEYNNPNGACDGVVLGFALYDTDKEENVPGYDALDNDQILQMVDLPENLSIVAKTNGWGGGKVEFGVEGVDGVYHTELQPPFAISGKSNGVVQVWDKLSLGQVTFWAKALDALGNPEPDSKKCHMEVHVEPEWSCPNYVQGFSLIDAPTGQPVPGYENIMGYRRIALGSVPFYLSLQAHANDVNKVRFYINGQEERSEGKEPYAINGDANDGTVYMGAEFLTKPGTYLIEARGRRRIDGSNVWEPLDDACALTLTVEGFETIDDDEYCAPEQVMPDQEGNHVFETRPVDVVEIQVNETVKFTTKNTIWDKQMDWVTTSFVAASGVEVCDKIENMPYGATAEHVYEAKCFGGFAFANVYAYSSEFTDDQASADTTFLPSACKNDFDGKVVKYTFVFSCDCENIPDIPEEVDGGHENPICNGPSAKVWGDPHVIPFDAKRDSDHWGCQGEGEFVLAKAELTNYDYDFEMRGMFDRFRYYDDDNDQMYWSFTSGVVAKQDVTVQISIGQTVGTKSNMFNDVPINFFVDGEQRLLSEGSGDHRVVVTVTGFEVSILFATTGVHITIQIRPFASDNHSGILSRYGDGKWSIPGSFSVGICLPADNADITNVMGLLGTPNDDTKDDFMDAMGNTLPELEDKKGKETTEYCREHWCVASESDSLFVFPTGEPGFDFYNLCSDTTWFDHRRNLQVVDIAADATSICNASPNPEACMEEAAAGGAAFALAALEDLLSDQKDKMYGKLAATPSDDACWSDDFKNCVKAEGCYWDATNPDSKKPNPHKAGDNCNPSGDGTVMWLKLGDDRDNYTCLAENDGGCDADGASCCEGLICDAAAKCVAEVSATRRLETFQFIRPDLPEERNIVPLFHSEL